VQASTDADSEAVEVVGVNKHRKLRKADLEKFQKKLEETVKVKNFGGTIDS
jgi:hypothetical protein